VVLPRLLDVVIIGRALPDVRDGLKPVHCRIPLWHAGGGPPVQQKVHLVVFNFSYISEMYTRFFWITSV
jgi:hypothetical protein